uniref:Bifunctional endo-1,4-beta-xylanase xylA n=1 Tax=Solanum tuberosum TaxID=4113 RepID=M1DC27_SOLTU
MKKRTSLIIKGSSMTGAPTNDQFRPPDPATGMNMHDIHTTIQESTSDSSYNSSQREEAIHTALAEQELDETCTNVSMEDLRQFHDTRIPAQQETQKSHDFSVPSVRNLQATVAENVGKSSQKRHQNRSIDEVIQTELAIGVCTTGRGGHPTDVLGNFHGEITGSDNSGESTGVQVNLAQKEDMQSLSQTQNTHRAGKEKVQELGQSSSSHLDVFVKKQGDTGTIPIDNSRSCVIPAYNSDTELHRTENHPSKVWVAKEQDHPTAIRQGQSNQGQQQGRFNNKSGDRLSKKRRQALKKKWKKSTGQDPDDTATGKQLDTHVDEQVANNAKKGRLTLDDYGAINYDDKLDPDNQSIENSDEDIEDTMHHTGQVLGSTFQDKCSDVQRMTKQQGLSPRERKQTRHKPHQPLTSMSDTSSRPMTRLKRESIEKWKLGEQNVHSATSRRCRRARHGPPLEPPSLMGNSGKLNEPKAQSVTHRTGQRARLYPLFEPHNCWEFCKTR